MDIKEEGKKLLDYSLCDSCLGRQFGKVDHGITNKERGVRIRGILDEEKTEGDDCWICGGLMDEIGKFADLIVESMGTYEYDTFLVGCKVDETIVRRENEIATKYFESIKRELNREIGKLVTKKTHKEPDFVNPDIVAVINTLYDIVELDIRSIFVYGRYNKLMRGLPQTKWYCRKCYGRGCDYCNQKGKLYDESVEEMIAQKAVEMFKADGESFHGAGREDIDVLMLGNGRPFILEVKRPRKRNVDMKVMQEKINEYAKGKVNVRNLKFAERAEIEELKKAKYPKTYRVTMRFEGNGKINEAVNALGNRIIKQRTPQRVVHRRADKVRCRSVLDMKIEELKDRKAVAIVTAESGTYIKELITGDNGRTCPSLSELAGVEIEIEKLDVIGIGD